MAGEEQEVVHVMHLKSYEKGKQQETNINFLGFYNVGVSKLSRFEKLSQEAKSHWPIDCTEVAWPPRCFQVIHLLEFGEI